LAREAHTNARLLSDFEPGTVTEPFNAASAGAKPFVTTD
jgi:hypothetical protein